jgi:uncharacterized membrane protein (DUF485 family)
MRSYFLLAIFIFCGLAAFSQASDFISVRKKNGITVKSIFPGSAVSLRTVYANDINGIVEAVKNDSLFVREYDVRSMPNQWGTFTVDTVGSQVIGFNYRDIETIVHSNKRSFSSIKNGTIFIIGGVGYALLNVINGSYLKESITGEENRKSLAIALGVAGAGFLLNRLHIKAANKRYNIVYNCMTCPNPRPF